MRFDTSDPDLSSIMNRIRGQLIDLQPDFQRGEVWPLPKKQRLIDSILRRWHVPPVHLVKKPGGKFDVLDGQQRLTAIRDFMAGAFPVGRSVEPLDDAIEALAGLRYEQLPEAVKNEFDLFTIRIFSLDDYRPEEPHELFFRLNQPTSLTEAEKRNAFIGGPRDQVKELVEWATGLGLSPEVLGFSNARMAYDDMLARFLLTVEQRSLYEKVTAARITGRYRSGDPFSDRVMGLARNALEFTLQLPGLQVADNSNEERIRPNKATLHSWLCMASESSSRGQLDEWSDALAAGMTWIEKNRFGRLSHRTSFEYRLLEVFQDRATSRVADVSSVILRDLTGWLVITTLHNESLSRSDIRDLAYDGLSGLPKTGDLEEPLLEFAQRTDWGLDEWI